jgi:hypothetical protein
MVDWFTTKIASTTEGLPQDHAIPCLGWKDRSRDVSPFFLGSPTAAASNV